MTDEPTTTDETHEPNEYGFAGEPTAPEPTPERRDEVDGEEIAVPAGDLTGATTGAIEELTDRDDEEKR
jgi:hypothetical protein